MYLCGESGSPPGRPPASFAGWLWTRPWICGLDVLVWLLIRAHVRWYCSFSFPLTIQGTLKLLYRLKIQSHPSICRSGPSIHPIRSSIHRRQRIQPSAQGRSIRCYSLLFGSTLFTLDDYSTFQLWASFKARPYLCTRSPIYFNRDNNANTPLSPQLFSFSRIEPPLPYHGPLKIATKH